MPPCRSFWSVNAFLDLPAIWQLFIDKLLGWGWSIGRAIYNILSLFDFVMRFMALISCSFPATPHRVRRMVTSSFSFAVPSSYHPIGMRLPEPVYRPVLDAHEPRLRTRTACSCNRAQCPRHWGYETSGTTFEPRMTRSRVSSGTLCTTLVAGYCQVSVRRASRYSGS